MPIRPPAPPRLSTTNCWPRYSDSLVENARAVMSLPPPGAKGTTTRTTLLGYCWLWAGAAAKPQHTAATASAHARFVLTCMTYLLVGVLAGRSCPGVAAA